MKKVQQFEDFLKEQKAEVVEETKSVNEEALDFKYKGKKYKIDLRSIEFDGIDPRDRPDYADAFISYAEDVKGKELPSEVIDAFMDEYPDVVSDLLQDYLY